MIKVCIFGAGSIGGYLAACLSKNNIDLSLIARGPHKKAIQENGLTLIKKDKTENFKLKVTDDPKELGIQDYIFISVKAHAISNIVESLQSLIGENTTIISAVNGLPWWYFHKANTGTNLDEKYIDSESAVKHGQNFMAGEYFDRFFNLFTLEKFIVTGPASQEFKTFTEENGFVIEYKNSVDGFIR